MQDSGLIIGHMGTPQFPPTDDWPLLDSGDDAEGLEVDEDLDAEIDLDVEVDDLDEPVHAYDDAVALFEDAIVWLRDHYDDYWKERDLV